MTDLDPTDPTGDAPQDATGVPPGAANESIPGTDPTEAPSPAAGDSPRSFGPELVTLSEAHAITGVSRKALARRVERQTLPSKKNEAGEIVVAKASLRSLGLLADDGSPGPEATPAPPPAARTGAADRPQVPTPGREIVVWRELVDEQKARAERAEDRAEEAERRATAAESALRELSGRIDQTNLFSLGRLRRARERILGDSGLPADEKRDR